LLEKKGVSYVVVTPKITKDIETPYIKVLTNQRTSLEDILTESALPGTPKRESEDSDTGSLSPVLRIGMAANLVLSRDPERKKILAAWSRGMDEAKVPGAEDLRKVAEDTVKEAVAMASDLWIQKIIKEGLQVQYASKPGRADSIWAGFVTDDNQWSLLQAGYLGKVRAALRSMGAEDEFDALNGIIVDEFARIRDKERAEIGDTQGPDTPGGRTSPGEYAMAISEENPLTPEAFALYDEILAKSFKAETVIKLDSAKYINKYGIAIYIHDDFEKRIATENDKRLSEGKSAIPFPRVHPGTWKGTGNRLHISSFIWNELTPRERKIVAAHERVHLEIYNYGLYKKAGDQDERQKRQKLLSPTAGTTYELWEKYLADCKKKKIPVDQENFVDQIKVKAYSFGMNRNDFPDCDTTRIRGDVAEAEGSRIYMDADAAMEARNEKALRIAFTEAYVLADSYGYTGALVDILDLFAEQDVSLQESLLKPIVYKVAEWYPLWIKQGLMSDITNNLSSPARELIKEKWFTESSANREFVALSADRGKNIVAVIMAGGGGERLGPISTTREPKQTTNRLLKDVSLITMAVERVIGDLGAENVYIQTVPHLKEQIYETLREKWHGFREENIFTEPKAADTAGAIGYAAAKLKKLGRGKDAMFVQTADHYIETASGEFKKAYTDAAIVARNTPAIGTLGIKMEVPSAEYGCIRKGPATFFHGVAMVEKFQEKPEIKVAEEMIAEGVTTYNSGMYIATAETWLDAFDAVAPDYGKMFRKIAAPDATLEDEEDAFTLMAKWKKDKVTTNGYVAGPVDKVLSEPLTSGATDRVALFMIEGKFHWRDIGGYKAIYEHYTEDREEGDGDNNVVIATNPLNISLERCSGCLVIANDDDVKISVKGMTDSVIAYNPVTKAVMVAPVAVAGSHIKDLLEEIKAKKGIAGYVSGDLAKIIPADKMVEISKTTGGNGKQSRVIESAMGDGIIKGSDSCVMNVSIGLGLILDMKGAEYKNTVVNVIPQEDNRDVPEISVVKVGDSAIANLLTRERNIEKLSANDRIDNMMRMIERGDTGVDELTPGGYGELYGIGQNEGGREEVEREVALIRERFERYNYCVKKFKPGVMGTSGYRGIADEDVIYAKDRTGDNDAVVFNGMTDQEVFINVKAQFLYLMDLEQQNMLPAGYVGEFIRASVAKKGDTVVLGGDLRPTTPRLFEITAAAIMDAGCRVDFQALISSPETGNYGINEAGVTSIMVTGSHNPYEQNGIKTFRSNGELLKPEEKVLRPYIAKVRREVYLQSFEESMFDRLGKVKDVSELTPEQKELIDAAREKTDLEKFKKTEVWEKKADEGEVEEAAEVAPATLAYIKRFVEAFIVSGQPLPLEGKEIIFLQQSTVGRETIPMILRALGAVVILKGKTDDFVSVDTEDLSKDMRGNLKQLSADHERETGKKPFAVLTADGDGDRPVFCDEDGNFLHGDKLGVVASIFLGLENVAIPITANAKAVEKLRSTGANVFLGEVGSPYMAIAALEKEGAEKADGRQESRKGWFEVNGGFGTASPLAMPNGTVLKPLSTRDAALPIICGLLSAVEGGKAVSQMIADTFKGYESYTQAGVVENLPTKTTPGCEAYTPEMGGAIVKSFSPKDRNIEQVVFDKDHGVVVTFKDDAQKLPISGDASQAQAMNNIR
ncbi:MAG: sugar phosphate nucleotidyltransferase, partial [Candidatus Omnitrophota bacterium]